MRYPLRYKGIGAIGGVEPSTVESQSTVLPLHHDHRETATSLGSACGGGGTRTPNRVLGGGSLAPSCITVLPRLRVENRGLEPLASCLQSRRSSN